MEMGFNPSSWVCFVVYGGEANLGGKIGRFETYTLNFENLDSQFEGKKITRKL